MTGVFPLEYKVLSLCRRVQTFSPPLARAMDSVTLQYCTPEEQLLSAQPNAPLHCLNRNESIAIAVCSPCSIRTVLDDADIETVLGAVWCIVIDCVSCDVRTDSGELIRNSSQPDAD
jgi:hypothetical protein